MKLIIHDLGPEAQERLSGKGEQVLYADGKYAPCQGCFKCWTKHPASCGIRDRLQETARVIGQAEDLTVITGNCYGGYSPAIKRLLDRSIGTSTPLSTYRGKQMHHTLRYGKHGKLLVKVYGDVSEKERETWRLTAERNAVNEGFAEQQVLFFATKEEAEAAEA